MEMIGDVEIPVAIDEHGDKWYPISRINKLFYNRDKINQQAMKSRLQHLQKKTIIMEFESTGVQEYECNCLNFEGLKHWVNATEVKRMSLPLKIANNKLREYCGIPLIQEKENYIYKLTDYQLKLYSKSELRLVELYHSKYQADERVYVLCNCCSKYYPKDSVFWIYNKPLDKLELAKCRKCNNNSGNFIVKDKAERVKSKIYDKFDSHDISDEILYKQIKDLYDVIPEYMINKNFIDNVLKWFVKNNKNYVFTTPYDFKKKIKIKSIYDYYNFYDVVDMFYGEYARYKPYKYEFEVDYTIKSKEYFKKCVDKYILEHKIDKNEIKTVKNIFNNNTRLDNLLQKCGYSGYMDFLVDFYDGEYAGYNIPCSTGNYYHNTENVLYDFKYLVEKDLKLEIYKIPTYITRNYLNTNIKPLYRAINKCPSNNMNSIFQVFNTLYPDTFEELDFDRHFTKEYFDSADEKGIHEILEEKFGKNLIYNMRSGSSGIKINGKMPDWIVIKEKPIIVEYFGLYVNRNNTNKRINEYKDRADNKVEMYSKLEHYDTLYFYPEDIENDYSGIRGKLENIS
jgi:hypothetical protein